MFIRSQPDGTHHEDPMVSDFRSPPNWQRNLELYAAGDPFQKKEPQLLIWGNQCNLMPT